MSEYVYDESQRRGVQKSYTAGSPTETRLADTTGTRITATIAKEARRCRLTWIH